VLASSFSLIVVTGSPTNMIPFSYGYFFGQGHGDYGCLAHSDECPSDNSGGLCHLGVRICRAIARGKKKGRGVRSVSVLSHEDLKDMYRKMVLIRVFEERMVEQKEKASSQALCMWALGRRLHRSVFGKP
jgi:hypothetical protein